MRAVRIVHQELFGSFWIGVAGQQGLQTRTVDRVIRGRSEARQFEDRGEQIGHRGDLALDPTRRNRSICC